MRKQQKVELQHPAFSQSQGVDMKRSGLAKISEGVKWVQAETLLEKQGRNKNKCRILVQQGWEVGEDGEMATVSMI